MVRMEVMGVTVNEYISIGGEAMSMGAVSVKLLVK